NNRICCQALSIIIEALNLQRKFHTLKILKMYLVTNHQPCWWFAVGPTGPMLLFRLKAVRQTIILLLFRLKTVQKTIILLLVAA
ncbi:MAG: hypothetical protein K1W41_00525, partial [Lachnospiraceae bacterium]